MQRKHERHEKGLQGSHEAFEGFRSSSIEFLVSGLEQCFNPPHLSERGEKRS